MTGVDDESHRAAQRELAGHALGAAIGDRLLAHVRDCALCAQDLAAYRRTAEIARDTDSLVAAPVPSSVWDGIAAELGLQATPAPAPTERAPRPRWRLAVLAAGAAVCVLGAGVVGWAIGHTTSPAAPNRSSQATLVAQQGTVSTAHGTATMHRSDNGYTMTVTTRGLPVPQGYYEVWLYDPAINQMVAVGTLGVGAQGTFTLPAGLDVGAYHVIDVSAQKYDGNNAHQRSVLRGPLAS